MQPLLIGPYQVGVQKNLKPFMIPDEAFPDMLNAFVWRGRVQRKAGYTLLGRLRRQLTAQPLGNTDGAGAFSGNVFTILGISATQPNASLTPGTITITVGAQVFTEPATPDGTLSNGGGGTGTINYSTGAITIQTNPVLAANPVTITFYYYPGLPVMGIRYYEDPSAINQERTIFWDTRFAYVFTTDFQELLIGTTWSGTDKDQFWTTNYFQTAAGSPLIWVTNYTVADNVKYYDGATWTTFVPFTNAGMTNSILTTLLIVPYKNRLVFLNTIENIGGVTVAFKQRARWSILGDPTVVNTSFRSDAPGFGGLADASTDEEIISCGFVKDELIVYFERSTWKFVYTGNENDPFIWQRINSELGAESTFSPVQFDSGLLALGNVGIHSCNGSQVKRIDEVIPDEVFNIHNGTDGPERVSAIRDFFQEVVYFAYPGDVLNVSTPGKISFPDKMIIYNYRNNTFSFLKDSATAFGYFQRVNSTPWSGLTTFPWSAWGVPWNSGVIESGFPSVNFGNQQGFVETIVPFISSNGPSLAIQNISGSTVTSPQHNLFVGDYVRITGAIGVTGVNDTSFRVETVPTENTFTIDGTAVGTYLGGGLITALTQLDISTKQFTPFWEKGKNYSLKYIDVLVDRTAAGELQVDVYIDFDTSTSMTDSSNTSLLGAPTLSTAPEGTNLPYYQFQQLGEQIWKRFYTDVTGETFQVSFSFSDTGMRTPNINNSDVVVHAMIFFFAEAGEFY